LSEKVTDDASGELPEAKEVPVIGRGELEFDMLV